MRVSIITPIYRVGEFIERCLRSLFEQTYDDIEYVFVDDASPDNSVEVLQNIIASYPQRYPHVKILSHKQNLGVAAARNTGLSAATGDYIYFVDADDWIERDTIKKFIKATSNGSIDIVGCGWNLSFTSSDRAITLPSVDSTTECLKAMLSGKMRWNLWLFMVRRLFYVDHNLHFPEGYNIGEDMLIMIKVMSFADSFTLVNEPLYHYVQQNSNSLTRMSPSSQIDIMLPNIKAVVEHLNNYNQDINNYLDYYKLNVKLPLIISDDVLSYKRWELLFPESHAMILKNQNQSLRIRIVQYMASKGQFWFVRMHYWLIYKLLYGVIYR